MSGYGEAHIRYDGPGALGRLAINQALRGGWSPRARHLFDKILHNRHDAAAVPGFFTARAIFVARDPGPAIRSIRQLYAELGRDEYGTDTEAATYYAERVEALADLWHRFPADRRAGTTHAALLAAPETGLAQLSQRLKIDPPLENRYESPAASRGGGAGDPTASGRFTRIEPRPPDAARDAAALDTLAIDEPLRRRAAAAYDRFLETIGAP